MKYTPENLLQIFMNGSLTAEAQGVFDRLMRENPEFAEKVTSAMAERMGAVPDETVNEISSRLDSKLETIWVKHQPSKMGRLFRVFIKGSLIFAVLGFLGYSVYALWPKLLTILPQIDLSSSSSLNTQIPKAQLAPPVMLRPQGSESETSISVKILPAPASKAVVAQKIVLPTATATLSKSSSGTQTGDSIRLSVDTDKTQTVVVTALSPNGILVRHLYQGLWVSGSHFVDWNGKDDSGNPVAPGNYTIVVQTGDKKMSGIVTIKPN
jgi:hypothetical protein